MRPTTIEVLRSIEFNLTTYVEPELTEKLAISAAHSMRYLLRHLIVRIEMEPQLLDDDNEDKRRLCEELVPLLRTSGSKGLSRLPDEIEALLAVSRLRGSERPTLASLTEENDAFRELIDRIVRLVAESRGECDPADYSQIDVLVVAQLLRQGERDARCFDETYLGPMF